MLRKEEKGNIEKLVDKQSGVLVVDTCARARAVFDGLWQDSINLITALVENGGFWWTQILVDIDSSRRGFQQTWILVDVDSSRRGFQWTWIIVDVDSSGRRGLPVECFTETFLL